NLLFARRWGMLGDKIGYTKIMIVLLFAAGLVYLPGAFVTNIWQLVIIRFLLGITIGGIVATRIAYIRQEAPLSMQGEVLGYNTSLLLFGNMIGPAIGGAIAGLFNIATVFIVTSSLLFVTGGVLLYSYLHYEKVDSRLATLHK